MPLPDNKKDGPDLEVKSNMGGSGDPPQTNIIWAHMVPIGQRLADGHQINFTSNIKKDNWGPIGPDHGAHWDHEAHGAHGAHGPKPTAGGQRSDGNSL